MLHRLRRGGDQNGLTLVELLVVVVIIGLLAAIAVPALISHRKKSEDASAKSLVRNGAAALEAHYIDGSTYAGATVAKLAVIEPDIAWRTTTASAASNQVNFGTPALKTYTLSTVSRSGVTWSWARNLGAAAGTPTLTRSCSPTTACKFKGVAGRW